MNKRTRYFMVGSAAIVGLGLCTGLVAFYGGGLPLMSASSRGPSEMAYLPADAVAVGYANVREVMDSEFRQKMLSVLPGREGQDEFFQHTGINIEHDIDTVLAAMPFGEPDASGVVLVRGRFNDGQIEGLISQHGGSVEQYQGVRVVVGNPAQMASPDMPRDVVTRHESFALAFLDIGLLAVGSETAVKAAIDAKVSGVNATTNTELMKYIGDMQVGQSAWAVGRFDAIANAPDMPAELKQHLPAVQWFSVSTRINGGVMGTMRAETADDVAAENLRDVVRGALAMGRLVSGEDMRMRLFLDSLQMSGTGSTVALTFSVSPEMLDALVGVAGMADSVPQTR